MLSNAYFLAKFRVDTAENEPAKNLQNLQTFCSTTKSRQAPRERDGPERRDRRPAEVSLAGSGRLRDRRGAAGPRLDPPGTRRVVANFWQNLARFRLYRRRSLQENMRFAAFFKIYQII